MSGIYVELCENEGEFERIDMGGPIIFVNTWNQLPDDELDRQEQRLREMLKQASGAAENDLLQAEQLYSNALQFASDVFGSRSPQAATASFHASAFYASCGKHFSARAHFEQLMLFLRS